MTVLLAAFGFIVIQLTKGELERLRGLPKLAVEIYAALRRAAAKVLAALRGLKISLPLGKRVKLPGMRPPGGGEQPSRRRFPSLDKGVRALLRRIARQAGKKGLRFRASQTPRSLGSCSRGSWSTVKSWLSSSSRAIISPVTAATSSAVHRRKKLWLRGRSFCRGFKPGKGIRNHDNSA